MGSSTTLYLTDIVSTLLLDWLAISGDEELRRNSSPYSGSFFGGEAFLNYKTSPSGAEGRIRMLAYAWVAPLPPYPKGPNGPNNPVMIGFKAWESAKPLEEIDESYDGVRWLGHYCLETPDLVQFSSIRRVLDYGKREYEDIFDLDFSPDPADGATVLFNGTTASNLDPAVGFSDVRILLPGDLSNSTGVLRLGEPPGLNMTGSITNTSMEIRLDGAGNGTREGVSDLSPKEDTHVSFSITFLGTFDNDNSTAAVYVSPANQSLSWVLNGGAHSVPIMFHLGCQAFMVVFCLYFV
ncbi:hypothetical protein FE257_008815 [Aspergillus nanangensis]|uniref:Uncharacterized protein n=1 Tax=Aspergillus nanangensis TaxID=2582783 RepID=A0AAD4CKK2_ASPNN|nr:hypothetical protein FE257_008815 [Aspergillus nanangensis]